MTLVGTIVFINPKVPGSRPGRPTWRAGAAKWMVATIVERLQRGRPVGRLLKSLHLFKAAAGDLTPQLRRSVHQKRSRSGMLLRPLSGRTSSAWWISNR
jgi:hypothetical protein